MELWDSNFYNLRSKHIFPLTSYQADYNKSQFNNLKILFSTRFNNITSTSSKTFELEFDAGLFYKSLINDIEFFYTRAIVQGVDVANSGAQSNAWRFVTQYYFSFFSVTALFRILRLGFIYFSKTECDPFNSLSTMILRSRIQISTGNYFFSYNRTEANGNLIFNLTNVGEGVHSKTWQEAANLITSFYNYSANDEKTILDVLKKMCREYKADFPSDTRNTVNYHGQFGIRSIINEFQFFETMLPRQRYIKAVMSYNLSTDVNKKAKDVGLFGYYFFLLTNDLLNDHYSRNHVKSDFHKKRTAYLKSHNLSFDS